MKSFSLVLAICNIATFAFGGNSSTAPLAEVAQHAVEQSKLTLTGSTPFHLRAEITETTNPDSDYKAEVEEYWVSPDKLRRTVTSPEFSQTLVVNGEDVFE